MGWAVYRVNGTVVLTTLQVVLVLSESQRILFCAVSVYPYTMETRIISCPTSTSAHLNYLHVLCLVMFFREMFLIWSKCEYIHVLTRLLSVGIKGAYLLPLTSTKI